MSPSTRGTAAGEAGPAGQQLPGPVRLAGMLTLSCLISQAGQATVTFAGELDAQRHAHAAPMRRKNGRHQR